MLNTLHSLIYTFRLTPSLAIRWMSLRLALFSIGLMGVRALYDIVHRRLWIAPSALRFSQLWTYARLFPGDRAYHSPIHCQYLSLLQAISLYGTAQLDAADYRYLNVDSQL